MNLDKIQIPLAVFWGVATLGIFLWFLSKHRGKSGDTIPGEKECNFLLTCLPAGREAEVMDLAIPKSFRLEAATGTMLATIGSIATPNTG
jgi:hypothetical protein